MGRPLTGGLSIVFAVFLMAVQDTVIKTMSGDMSLWQLFVLRSPVALVLLSLIALSLPRLSAGKAWRHALMPWALVRSLCVLLMYIFMYLSFPYLKLAEMGAAFYTAPIFTALMSALFLKDRVGLQGWRLGGCGLQGAGCGVGGAGIRQLSPLRLDMGRSDKRVTERALPYL